MQCAHELSSKSPALKAATLWVRVPLPKSILALPTGWGEGLGMSWGLPGSAGPAWARGRAPTGPGGEQGHGPGGSDLVAPSQPVLPAPGPLPTAQPSDSMGFQAAQTFPVHFQAAQTFPVHFQAADVPCSLGTSAG